MLANDEGELLKNKKLPPVKKLLERLFQLKKYSFWDVAFYSYFFSTCYAIIPKKIADA